MAEYWIDGTSGSESNNGLSEVAPKRDFSSSIPVTDGTIVNLKSGTTIALTASRFPQGDYTIRAYGSGSRPKLTIQGGTYQLTHTGTTAGKVYRISGIEFEQTGTADSTCPANGPNSAATMIVEDCVVNDGFQYGIRVGYGDRFVVRNNTVTCSGVSGIQTGTTGQNAPSGGLIERNTVNADGASDDGISLHDGNTGTGSGNVIRDNIVISGAENCIDVLKPYINSKVYGNTLTAGSNAASTWSVVAMQGSGSVYGNNLNCGIAVALLIHAEQNGECRFFSNLVICGAAEANGQFLKNDSAQGARVYNNTVVGNASATRALITVTEPAGLTINNNYFVHGGSDQKVFNFTAAGPAAGSIDGNFYEAGTSVVFEDLSTFEQWRQEFSVDGMSIVSPASRLDTQYRPNPGDKVLGRGVDIGYVEDFDRRRGRAFIGAFAPRIAVGPGNFVQARLALLREQQLKLLQEQLEEDSEDMDS